MKKKKEVYNKNIKGKNPFLDEIPLGNFPNSMTTIKTPKSIFFRPNNYRRQIEVKIKDNSTIKKITGAIPKSRPNKHTKIISIKNYEGITIQYGRSILTGIYSQSKIGNDKLIYFIERNTIKELNERIDEIGKEIEEKIDFALNKFIDTFKIRLPMKKPIWVRYEDFVKKESFIDSIPRDTIIYDTIFKKVYGKGIEFISTKKGEKPTVNLKNYITNRAIEDISPEIAAEINNMYSTMSKPLKDLNESIQLEIYNKKLHLEVLKDMKKALKDISTTLKKKPFKKKKLHLEVLNTMKKALKDISTTLKKKPLKKRKKQWKHKH